MILIYEVYVSKYAVDIPRVKQKTTW